MSVVQIEPLGESGYLLRSLPREPWQVADVLRAAALPGVQSVIAAYETVAVYFSGDGPTLEAIENSLIWPEEPAVAKQHIIPVCYELGEDLTDAAEALRMSEAELIELHSADEYTCAAIGFTPGFPYLGPLPEALRGVPRRSSPRLRVPKGSVAITGNQTAIYPTETPGGWALIGRCPLCIVDPADDYYPIVAGDRVRFVRIFSAEFEARLGERLP